MSDTDDEWRPSCYECGREMARRNLQPTPVHIEHDDEPGYDRVNVPMCHGCRLEMFPTHECEHCGEEYLDISDAVECCQHRQGRPMPDGGDVEMAGLQQEIDWNHARVPDRATFIYYVCPECDSHIISSPRHTTGVMPMLYCGQCENGPPLYKVAVESRDETAVRPSYEEYVPEEVAEDAE